MGFTLVELLITLALIGILAAYGGPALTRFVNDQRLSGQTNEFIGDLMYARSEAIKRGIPVGVCARVQDTLNCGAADFTHGWIVFVDTDNSNTLSAADLVLRTRDPLSGISNVLKPEALGANKVFFGNRGIVATGMGSYASCDSRGSAFARVVTINSAGETRVSGKTAQTPSICPP